MYNMDYIYNKWLTLLDVKVCFQNTVIKKMWQHKQSGKIIKQNTKPEADISINKNSEYDKVEISCQ